MGRKKLYTDEELRERRRARGKLPRHYTPEQREENRIKARADRAARSCGTHDLLGGATRKSIKPRGFIDGWKPIDRTQVLLDQVKAILEEYREHLPLTLRQIYYRLVGVCSYEKTDLAYMRLSEILNRARRARAIDMDAIRDDGGAVDTPHCWESKEHFIHVWGVAADIFRLDRTNGQTSRLVVMCEAAGMVPQLASVCNPFGITVRASGGFDSLTEKHAFAKQLSEDGRPTEVLHIGDHDPSGAHLFLALAEDVQAFCENLGGEVEFTRLAVTPIQIEEMNLQTAPKKVGDARAFAGETCQAEAIAPDDLAEILTDAIEERLDRAAYNKVLKAEQRIRRELKSRLGEKTKAAR